MRKRKYQFTPAEISQMLIDKLIADQELENGRYEVSIGATKHPDQDMVIWIEVEPTPKPIQTKSPT